MGHAPQVNGQCQPCQKNKRFRFKIVHIAANFCQNRRQNTPPYRARFPSLLFRYLKVRYLKDRAFMKDEALGAHRITRSAKKIRLYLVGQAKYSRLLGRIPPRPPRKL